MCLRKRALHFRLSPRKSPTSTYISTKSPTPPYISVNETYISMCLLKKTSTSPCISAKQPYSSTYLCKRDVFPKTKKRHNFYSTTLPLCTRTHTPKHTRTHAHTTHPVYPQLSLELKQNRRIKQRQYTDKSIQNFQYKSLFFW